MKRKDAVIEVSVIAGEAAIQARAVPRYPHLLLQTFPSAQSDEALLTRVIARDTAATSTMTVETGEAAAAILDGPGGNELAWMRGCRAVAGSYARGSFRGALGTVLGTEQIGGELRAALRAEAAQ